MNADPAPVSSSPGRWLFFPKRIKTQAEAEYKDRKRLLSREDAEEERKVCLSRRFTLPWRRKRCSREASERRVVIIQYNDDTYTDPRRHPFPGANPGGGEEEVARETADPVPAVSRIGGADDCGYNVQSNRRDIRFDMFRLSSYRGDFSRDPQADTSRLIGWDDVVVHMVLTLLR
ncbi:hypothetical protein B296_00037838 [Ensete ventricosum]|uniref:Uncharacterized protein n=1 Tax=Ensete ventricosum TaxID=4639 RepID=A0A426XZP3_ENSVE|nr:hypothetical protein B296_00037838 [Ensete ventricosum]